MTNQDKNYIVQKLAEAQLEQAPFTHTVIEDFLPIELANQLYNEFPDFDNPIWFNYKNKIEDKKLLSDWRQTISYRFSQPIIWWQRWSNV